MTDQFNYIITSCRKKGGVDQILRTKAKLWAAQQR